MTYINLSIRKYKDNSLASLSDAISLNEVVVLLGAPGSGKTSLLEKYKAEHPTEAQFIKIKNFLKLSYPLPEREKVLLLDGLDEYRSVSSDKTFVTTELGNKLSLLKNIKAVISCREMDWFGEDDKAALKNEINKDVGIYCIEPLNNSQKNELAKILEINPPGPFIDKFSSYGFLENPQMFVMVASLYKDGEIDSIGSKTELYLKFVENAGEKNPEYKHNRFNEITKDEILKYSGYLAAFYIFSGQDEFDDAFVDGICDSKQDYTREKLQTVLKTTLFRGRTFIHRTVAEFVLAYFLKKYKLQTGTTISFQRIKNLFVQDSNIPTGLRGTYAWLCSLTSDDRLIEVDPYYQAIHGDNSSFADALKKKIVLQVKEYAKVHPYFFQSHHVTELEGFYNERLDHFFGEEFEDALRQKNHYILFVIHAIVTTPILSTAMKDFLKGQIEGGTFPSYYKSEILDSKAFENEFKLKVLNCIREGTISDESDNIKECLLRELYPIQISPDEVVDYLMLYSRKVIGYCFFLFETPYEKKFALVDAIYQRSYNPARSPKLALPDDVKEFIEDYFQETLLKFETTLTAKEIYEVIKHFRSKYHEDYECLNFKSYRYEVKDELQQSDQKLNRLANNLFSLYLDDILREQNKDDIWVKNCSFHYFFNLKIPTEATNTLLGKLSSANNSELNTVLFSWALSYARKEDAVLVEKLTATASEFGLESVLHNWQRPPKMKWQIEEEERKRKQKEEDKKNLERNEAYFKDKKDSELQRNFNVLFHTAQCLYMDEDHREKDTGLSPKTFARLKNILKDAIYQKLIDTGCLTLESLAGSPQATRNIDIVYYVSSQLNSEINLERLPVEFVKYLYINTLLHRHVMWIVKDGDNARFIPQIERDQNNAREILREYIAYLVMAHLENHRETITRYTEQENDLEKLKNMVILFVFENNTIADTILNNFLKIYNFNIKLEDLTKLNDESCNPENKNTILALLALLEERKLYFTINMAIAFHLLFRDDHFERFSDLPGDKKVRIIDYMMSQFNTEESIEFKSGFQSDKEQCASFLTNQSLQNLNSEELLQLQNARAGEDDIWTNRIAHFISLKKQEKTDQAYKSYDIDNIKNFILSGDILSSRDFFEDICGKMELLKQEIEDDRNNDKKLFYNHASDRGKNENECRDVITVRLKDKYGKDIVLIQEKLEGDNRADLNIQYKADRNFEVQVECKKDSNADIESGIADQLIAKYLSSKVQYGIYLVFFFRENKKNKEELCTDLINMIPADYKDRIRVICIDLTRSGKSATRRK